MPLVKICGARTVNDAHTIVESGADMIGLNFIDWSKRKISIEQATTIRHHIPSHVATVGVCADMPIHELHNIADLLNLDFIQLHGSESLDYVKIVSRPVIKVFRLDPQFDVEIVKQTMKPFITYSPYILLDRSVQGTGEMLDEKRSHELSRDCPLFYAGGLTPENVAHIVSKVQPTGVDVASGVETNGTIDPLKVQAFVSNAKHRNSESVTSS